MKYIIKTYDNKVKHMARFFKCNLEKIETIIKMPENIWDAASYLTCGKWNMNSKPINVKTKFIVTTDIYLN